MTTAPERLPPLLAFPPLLYATAFVLGLALHWLVPLRAAPPAVARTGGVALAIVSIALLIWARVTLHRPAPPPSPAESRRRSPSAGPTP